MMPARPDTGEQKSRDRWRELMEGRTIVWIYAGARKQSAVWSFTMPMACM